MQPSASVQAKAMGRPSRSWLREHEVLELEDLVQVTEESLELIPDDLGTLVLSQGDETPPAAARRSPFVKLRAAD